MRKWLTERDRDIYESDLAEDAARDARSSADHDRWLKRLATGEGYDPDLDFFGERAEERQRLIEGGTQ